MADVTFEKFGGLNLVSDPQEAGAEQAVSCVNVALDRNGRLRTRDGYDAVYSAASIGSPSNMHPYTSGQVLGSWATDKVRIVDVTTGTSAANVALTGSVSHFASVGTATYFTDGTNAQIRKYDGAFSSPASLATYEGNFLTVQPLDDRLVIADANSASKLWFSDAATPETINAANFLEVTPGDGEQITGMTVFGTELFVFKRTKFFVFYGNSTDATGGAVFNYRMVDAGVGIHQGSGDFYPLCAAHSSGVYFVYSDGVYRTAGGSPVKVSGAIDPVFKGMNQDIPAPFSSVVASPVTLWRHLTVCGDFLYLTNGDVSFVMDIRTGTWTVFNYATNCHLDGNLVASPSGSDSANLRGTVLLGGGLGTNAAISKAGKAFSDDDGTAITWHHQSGFYDLGSQNTKRTRRTVLWGSGTPTVSVFTDHGTSDSNAGSVTLGTAPAVARGYHQKAYRGVLFSHKLSGTAAATVHRIGHMVADERMSR